MRPISDIHLGDEYASPHDGSELVYTVVGINASEQLVELKCNYQHPSRPATFWRPNTDRIFAKRIHQMKPNPYMKKPINLTPSEITVLVQHYESLAKTMLESAHNFSADVQAEFKQLCDEYAQRSSELREDSIKEPEPNIDAIKTREINVLVQENRRLLHQLGESQRAISDAIFNILERGGHEEWPIVKRLRSVQTTGNWASGHNTPPCNAKP